MSASNSENASIDYAPDGSHLKQNAVQWQDLARRPLEDLANFTLFQPLPEGRLQFRFLNEEICVDIPRRRLLRAEQVRKGTHITAMGSDTREKNELDPAILARADLVVADSIEQCRVRGEICQALKAGVLSDGDVIELGNVIANPALRRTDDSQITVADLTGVAVQDIQISKAVYEVLR
jgi:ornithine cyclodeaminase